MVFKGCLENKSLRAETVIILCNWETAATITIPTTLPTNPVFSSAQVYGLCSSIRPLLKYTASAQVYGLCSSIRPLLKYTARGES